MMRQYELVERVLKYDPNADEGLLNGAYVYAMKAHGKQIRNCGAPYFSHPLEVAAILTELQLDDATIATALLHDTIEDTDATRAEIEKRFGPKIGELVDGLTKIKRLDLGVEAHDTGPAAKSAAKKAEQAENFRKLLLAISGDIRVLLVKLADRLHNMRSLEHNSPESRQRNSQETLDVYAPLAGRIGMQGMREELEEHSFRWLNPAAYKAVTEKLAELRRKTAGLLEETQQALVSKLVASGIKAEVTGREKKPYSIWVKTVEKKTTLEKLSDIYAFRVIVETEADCYRALGCIHTTWQAVPGRFKDYISVPKQNNYQSLHTTVIGPRNQRMELQIRTQRMHDTAEYGIAAHAYYKETRANPKLTVGGVATNGTHAGSEPQIPDKDANPYMWLRRMVESLREGDNAEDFLEHTKLELFRDQVFCFTPKGRLIALPRGATPLDFAYAVHTDVGAIANGAIVNGHKVPIETKLRNGDEVEILTNAGHTHPAAWEAFAVTGRAQLAIRRSARDSERKRYVELGRRLLSAQFETAGQELPGDLRKLPVRFNQKTVDDVLTAIARGEITAPDAAAALANDGRSGEPAVARYKPRRGPERGEGEDGWFNLTSAAGLKFRAPDQQPPANGHVVAIPGIPIRSLGDVAVSFEPGGAVPGDRIVGVLMLGEGMRIFQIHSPRLLEYEQERWIDVTWDVDKKKLERYPATIDVQAPNQPGTLAQVAALIGQAGGNIEKLFMHEKASDFTTMRINLGVYDLPHLTHIIDGLRAHVVVTKAERVFE